MSSNIETLFSILDSSSILLRKELDVPYLEALAETGENLFEGAVLQDVQSSIAARLEKEYAAFQQSYTAEEIRKALQLAVLKGMKEGIQAHHEMTPDAVGLFMGYLFHKFLKGKSDITVLDPAVGTGNLLTTIMNSKEGNVNMNGFAVEVDELLLRLAFVSSNLQKHPIEFFNQDGLASLYIDPVDAVVCDLPIGYYPNEERAKQYTLKAAEGMSYAHHLFIEQSVKHTKAGGYIFLLIPNFLFEGEQAKVLHLFLQEHCYIQGLLHLSVSMFKNEKNAKSICILQKKDEGIMAPKQTLLVNLPKFSNMGAMETVIHQMNDWFQKNKS